jgi:hypothetical protein
MMILSRCVCLVALAFGTGATSSLAGDLVLTRAAQSGVASLIGYERAWNRNCQDVGTTVTITGQPSHGSVSVEQGSSTIPASTPRSGSTGQCAGRQIAGNQVMYRSEPGFHGRDHVSWHVVYGNGKSGETNVTIAVR